MLLLSETKAWMSLSNCGKHFEVEEGVPAADLRRWCY